MSLLAQSQGDQCSTIGEVKTVTRTVIDGDGAKQIIVTRCTCTKAEDSTAVRVVAFNTSEGWSRDVSEDVAREVLRRVARCARPLAVSSRKFVDAYVDEDGLLRAESGVA
jgi:hypothetical protein